MVQNMDVYSGLPHNYKLLDSTTGAIKGFNGRYDAVTEGIKLFKNGFEWGKDFMIYRKTDGQYVEDDTARQQVEGGRQAVLDARKGKTSDVKTGAIDTEFISQLRSLSADTLTLAGLERKREGGMEARIAWAESVFQTMAQAGFTRKEMTSLMHDYFPTQAQEAATAQ